jgi:hypothetical protein
VPVSVRAILDIRDELRAADGIMEKYDFQKSALIQILLDVQEGYRWLPRHILRWVSGCLNVPLKEIFTIARLGRRWFRPASRFGRQREQYQGRRRGGLWRRPDDYD